MSIHRKPAVLLRSIAAAALLSACGGSSSGLSRSQLADKVNAACTSYNTAVKQIAVPNDFATNPVAAAAYLDRVKPLVQKEYDSIVSLKPDGSVKGDFETYINRGKHQIALFNRVVAKAHARDRTGLADLQAMAAYKQTALAPLDRKLGFTACVG